MVNLRRHAARAPLLAALGAALLANAARADGVSATAEANFSSGSSRVTDVTGRTLETFTTSLPQRYRLSIDKELYPYVLLNGTGLYQWTPGWTSFDGTTTSTDAQRWSVFASVLLGPPILNATPYYLRRQEFATVGGTGNSFRSPTLVNQAYGVYAGWNPVELPLLNLRFGRNEFFDLQRTVQDTVTDEVIANLSYLEVKDLALRYSLRWSNTDDRIAAVKSTDLNQGVQVTWSGSYFGRLVTSVNYSGAFRTSSVDASGSGTVALQQFPVGGLSLVEAFPAVPSQNTLLPNPALIDGDLLAGAGIDIGFGPSLAGDQNYRDVGVLFPNTTTDVNTLRVWVDRSLPPAVAGSYVFTAWSSTDNVTWTQLPITGPVTFGVFENRFEIPIQRTAARYLKVVTRPLTTAVTTDPQYRTVLVTEVQTFLVVPASAAPRTSQQFGGNFSGNARLLLWRDWNLAYLFSITTSHQDGSWFQDWSVMNSFSAARQVAPSVSVSAQISRTDSAQTNLPHEAVSRWSAQVAYDPFPTIGASLSYAGQFGQLSVGEGLSNSVTLFGHVDPWQGISLVGTAGYTWARDTEGRTLQSPNATVGFSLTPMQALTLNGTWALSSSIASGGNGPVRTDQTSSLQGNVSFTPIPALYFSAGVLRSMGGGDGPQTLLNFGAGFSPFAGGQVLIRFGYDENVDTFSRVRNRFFGPSVRWNIRSGTYLDVAYSWNDSIQPSLISQSRNFFANLFISFL